MTKSLLDRIADKVLIGDDDWIWTGARSPEGYGFVASSDGNRLAHRVVYELLVGPIPEGLVLDHIACDTPSCVRPSHLKPVSHQENILRGTGPTAINAAKTRCVHGHLFDVENTYWRKDARGGRECRACNRRRARKP